MKQTLNWYLVALPIVLIFSCVSGDVELSKLQNRNGFYYQVNQEKAYNGKVIEYHSDKSIQLEGLIKDGLRQGEWIEWYLNGQKKSQGNYVDGLKDGNWYYWEENGTSLPEEVFKEGEKLGEQVDTNPDDSVKWVDVPENTTVDLENQSKAVRFGLLKGAVKKGALRKTLNGEPYTGPVVDYYDNGRLKLEGYFKDGLRTGKWTYYYENGKVEAVKQF